MLQLPEFRGLHLVRYLLGIEHSLHGCIEEFDCDISSEFAPDIVPGKFIDPLRELYRGMINMLRT